MTASTMITIPMIMGPSITKTPGRAGKCEKKPRRVSARLPSGNARSRVFVIIGPIGRFGNTHEKQYAFDRGRTMAIRQSRVASTALRRSAISSFVGWQKQQEHPAIPKLVPLAGLEPARCCHHLILSQARLPLPPQGHGRDHSGRPQGVNAPYYCRARIAIWCAAPSIGSIEQA